MNEDIAGLADPEFEQHFLSNPAKLTMLVDAADIQPTEHVVELGAGAGTVARTLPPSASLTLVELDRRLIPVLRRRIPQATVIEGDGAELMHQLRCDVLLCNMPTAITELLLDRLHELRFRVAVVAVSPTTDLNRLGPELDWSEITTVTGDDFTPPQSGVSRLLRIGRSS